jgi:cytochrome oxidase assembly protein ShyY1
MRLPLIPTIVVAAAVAVMIGLGVWQLQRADWKQDLIARYQAAQALPPVAWPSIPPADNALLFRRAEGFCTEVTGWRTTAGGSRGSRSGWSHVASCRTGGLEGPGMQVDMGWGPSTAAPAWRGGEVSGIIVPDRQHRIRLVSAQAAPGLLPSAAPDPADVPNNHLMYAFQWFFFAIVAVIIYILALRRRQSDAAAKVEEPAPKP